MCRCLWGLWMIRQIAVDNGWKDVHSGGYLGNACSFPSEESEWRPDRESISNAKKAASATARRKKTGNLISDFLFGVSLRGGGIFSFYSGSVANWKL